MCVLGVRKMCLNPRKMCLNHFINVCNFTHYFRTIYLFHAQNSLFNGMANMIDFNLTKSIVMEWLEKGKKFMHLESIRYIRVLKDSLYYC